MRKFLLFILMICLEPSMSLAAPLHDAAKAGDVAAITAALDAGADIEASEGGGTPLYFAVRRGHLAAAKLLLERGADVIVGSNYSGDVLTIATAKLRVDLMTLLLAHGANPNSTFQGESVLHVAVKYRCLACVKALVEAGADVNAPTYDTHSSSRTPIHIAIRYGYPEVADYLMAHGVVVPTPAPVTAKLAAADPEKGRIFFNENCTGCHYGEPNKARNHGPNLWGVVGREKASMKDVPTSKVLRDWGGTWTYEDLNTYLYGPTFTKPGGLMEVPSIPDENSRADLIAYLRTLSDMPVPLP
ncbi:MAG TPA: ankyrin repeat domain-containing protein [Aestuariivirga sp.]|nr:ankyrin repeat domain-containing protein [Aestuariivirga sp.]